MRRRLAGGAGRALILAAALSILLGACTAQQIGQTIYNSMKAHCDSNPDVCTALDDY
ncbi:MAG: hypothetical protein QNJ67_16925 [Kiloniellales bacterium]|nr:hypothetical protein [Kiloniellales bacterium]